MLPGERADIPNDINFQIGSSTPINLALIALDRNGRSSALFSPLDAASRELRPAGSFGEDGELRLHLTHLPDDVVRLLIVVYDPQASPLGCRVDWTGNALLRFVADFGGRADAAAILAEVYRYRSAWRLAANGQGFSGGLMALASAYGVDLNWARRLGHIQREREVLEDRRPPLGSIRATGSGVAIDRHHILSNAHVVEDAERITVMLGGRSIHAQTVFADPRNDLALLHVDTALPTAVKFRPGLGLHLGEDIVVLGFPLQGLLGSGPHASAGNIAALCGIGNDSSLFQFTAPIASGNSGGPILDMAGQLVGLVSSSLNLDRIRQAGNNAENVNFGIKGATMRSFLDAYGIEAALSDDDEIIGRAQVVRRMRDAIFRIACLANC